VIERELAAGAVRVRFLLPVSEGEVSIVGSFNAWVPGTHPLRTEGPVQSVAVEFAPGSRHEFRYLGSHGRWFDDPDADGRDGDNCLIVIEEGEENAPVVKEAIAPPKGAPRRSSTAVEEASPTVNDGNDLVTPTKRAQRRRKPGAESAAIAKAGQDAVTPPTRAPRRTRNAI
jgi:hypothetical protein